MLGKSNWFCLVSKRWLVSDASEIFYVGGLSEISNLLCLGGEPFSVWLDIVKFKIGHSKISDSISTVQLGLTRLIFFCVHVCVYIFVLKVLTCQIVKVSFSLHYGQPY